MIIRKEVKKKMVPNVKTSAQGITFLGYNEPTRNLHFKAECQSLEDLKGCVKIIDEYNEFNWQVINKALDKYVSFKRYYGLNNPNNGKDLFEFSIGREGSPVMYIRLFKGTGEFGSRLKMTYQEGEEIKELTNKEFSDAIISLGKETKADECEVTDKGYALEARLWWD